MCELTTPIKREDIVDGEPNNIQTANGAINCALYPFPCHCWAQDQKRRLDREGAFDCDGERSLSGKVLKPGCSQRASGILWR
jgi:hypothetical protein